MEQLFWQGQSIRERLSAGGQLGILHDLHRPEAERVPQPLLKPRVRAASLRLRTPGVLPTPHTLERCLQTDTLETGFC